MVGSLLGASTFEAWILHCAAANRLGDPGTTVVPGRTFAGPPAPSVKRRAFAGRGGVPLPDETNLVGASAVYTFSPADPAQNFRLGLPDFRFQPFSHFNGLRAVEQKQTHLKFDSISRIRI